MALGKANGLDILEARVLMPSVGAWTADVVLDTRAGPDAEGSVTLDFGALQLVGTGVRGGLAFGVTTLRVVGGAAGLGTVLAPKDYRQVPLRTVLSDVLAAAGETLSTAADPDALAYQLTRWTTFAQAAGEVLEALGAEVGRAWRVLADGTVWLGTESYPVASPEFDLMAGDPHLGAVEVSMPAPLLIPGVGFLGQQVAHVEHVVGASGVRSRVSFS